MIDAAFKGDLRTVKRLQIELSVAVARTKFAKAADAAMRTFLDFIDPRKECTAAYCAAEGDHLKIIRLLHELRAGLDEPNTADGGTPASIAAHQGQTAMVQLLYDLGADVHRAANVGTRPIHDAAKAGCDEAVLLLLSLRADINWQDGLGCTPIWLAAGRGKPNTVRLLVSYRASLDLANNLVITPLYMASLKNKRECIAVLAAAKASLEGAMAASPIGAAAMEGGDESVRLLAHLGARLVEPRGVLPRGHSWPGGPFWHRFKDHVGRVRDPALWERIVRKGGDEGTPESVGKRIGMLKKAGVNDPRDGNSW